MTIYSKNSKKYVVFLSCLLIFAFYNLLVPMQAIAQSKSTNFTQLLSNRIRRVQASFAYNPVSPKAGQNVQFTDTSTNTPTSWQWNFGDGTTDTAQNPSHTFTVTGLYKVSLTASNSAGARTVSRTISVLDSASAATSTMATAASFTYSPSSPATKQAVQFTDTSAGSPTSWQWNFGDGSTSTAQNPSHAFATAASYTVTLTATNNSGSQSVSHTVTVVPALAASFTYSPTSPVAGQAIQFTDTSAGSPTSWQWNFGDGSTSTAQNPSHAFATAASYMVTLTAANNSGSQSVSHTVSVVPALAASFTYSPASPVAGQAIQFTDTSAGSPTSWQWNFGDGSTSTAQNPSHTYATVASYNVTLTVGNSAGSKSSNLTINVLPSSVLIASFSYNPTSPVAGQAIQFTDTSTGQPTSWQWGFGDGTSSTAQNPSHIYSVGTSYVATLTIQTSSNSNNTSKTITVQNANIITAASPSLADVKAAIDSANPGDTVNVPAGTATWSSQLEITKGILLIGAGIGNTIIMSNYTAAGDNNPADALIYYHQSPSVNAPFKISGFSWELANKCMFIYLENLTTTPLTKTRIDHNYIHNSNGRTIINNGATYGVIDNNSFDVPKTALSSYGLNETSWTYLTFSFGTADNMYFEDNTVTTGDCPHDGGAGGRVCVRHNTYTYNGSVSLWPWCDMHGNMGTGGNLAGMGVEFYENQLTSINNRQVLIIDQRGGRGVCFNNTVTTSGGANTRWREEYSDYLNSPATSSDGETQHVCNSYFWNNMGGPPGGMILITPTIDATVDYNALAPAEPPYRVVPQFDLDCWKQVSSFNGSTGMGVGLKSGMPASCALEGAGYWAIDEYNLYRWHNGAWQLYYTPYTYPHPLRSVL